MTEQDSLQNFIIENADVRGEIVRLTESYKEILADNYPDAIKKLLGETLLATVLLAGSLKFQGTLTLQFNGEGPIRILVASCNHELQVRGLAKYDEQAQQHEFATAFNQGRLVITITPDNAVKPYQSIIAINGQSIAECLEYYFAQSEQLLTKFRLITDETRAAGMLIQQLPVKNLDIEKFTQLAVQIQGAALNEQALLNLSNIELLQQVYTDQDIRLFDSKAVEFKCSCNVEKMRNAIKVMGEKEAFSLLSTLRVLEVRCEYCNKTHEFDKLEVMSIFNPSTKH